MKILTLRKKKLLVAAMQLAIKSRTDRKHWVHPMNKLRPRLGDHLKLEIKYRRYPDRFKKETRLTPSQFDKLLEMTEADLQTSAIRTDCISPRVRLYVTLKYLAHGTSMAQLSDGFCMGHSTVGSIINETTRIIWRRLSPIYMPPPTESDWKRISKRFLEKWNFPHCVGALDGKHVLIQRPNKSGSEFFNYKNQFSTNLMALADADYRFIFIDVGGYGKSNDSRIFRDSNYGQKILTGQLNLPPPELLPNSTMPSPYMIVADDAFPMTTNIMKPFPGRKLTSKQRIFNYRLSRARRVVENSFGILASRFRIFRRPICGKVANIDYIVMAACILHNFLRTSDMNDDSSTYFMDKELDVEDRAAHKILGGSWRKRYSGALRQHSRIGSNNYPVRAAMLRDALSDYFVEKYPLSWQANYVEFASFNPVSST